MGSTHLSIGGVEIPTLFPSIGGGEIPHVHGATAQVHGATALLPSKLKEESEQVCDALR